MLLRYIFALALLLGAVSAYPLTDDPIPGCDPCPGVQVR